MPSESPELALSGPFSDLILEDDTGVKPGYYSG